MKTLSAVPGTWRVSKCASSISLFCTWYVLTDIFSPDCQLLEFRIHVSNVFRFQCIAWILWQGRPTSWLLKSPVLYSRDNSYICISQLSLQLGVATWLSPRRVIQGGGGFVAFSDGLSPSTQNETRQNKTNAFMVLFWEIPGGASRFQLPAVLTHRAIGPLLGWQPSDRWLWSVNGYVRCWTLPWTVKWEIK